jgi:hypothetical protein
VLQPSPGKTANDAKEGSDIPIHAMKANKGSEGTAPDILILCTRGVVLSAAWPSQCTMREKCTRPITINQKAWWVPHSQSGCFREERNFLPLPETEPPDCWAHSTAILCYSVPELI